MSYNNKLEQTGRKVASARRKYYGSFDYGSGLSVGKKGGVFSFGKKFLGGGGLDDEWIDEPDVQADIEKYWRSHPREAIKMGLSPFTGKKWNKEALEGTATSALGAVSKLADELTSQQDKKDALLRRYNTFGTSELSGITDNTGLLSAFASTPLLSTPTAETFRNKSYGQDMMSALSAGVNGAISTKSPWGALFGVADAATSIFGRAKARRNAEELAPTVKRKNLDFLKDFSVAAQDVDARNDFGRMLGYYNDPLEYAFGGPLQTNGGDYNGGLTYIDEGGRHEENPYEGVPSGVDANGVPNLVEEGEIIWNDDYVFSDRLDIPEELKEKYKLGRGGKKVTFADAIAKLTKENNISPNDPITKDTTKAIVEEFIDAQEKIRTENQLEALEELDIAQMNDFLAQLDAAQSMGMQAPQTQQGMEMSDYGMELPNEAPVTEGEMMPPGYAFGGHKFERGSWKKHFRVESGDNGETLYIAPDGTVLYSEEHAKDYYKQKGNNWRVGTSFLKSLGISLPSDGGYTFDEVDSLGTEAKKEYDKIIQQAKQYKEGSPKYNEALEEARKKVLDIVSKNYDDRLKTREQQEKERSEKSAAIDRQNAANEYLVKQGYLEGRMNRPGYVSAGDMAIYKDILAGNRDADGNLIRSTATASSEPSETAGQPDATTKAQVPVDDGVEERLPSDEVAQERKASPADANGGTPSSGRGKGLGNNLYYDRKLGLKASREWEANKDYQTFLNYMRSNPESEDAKSWMDFIQSEIKNSGSTYQLKDFDDWSRLAEDGKIGYVHQATLKAAQEYAKRNGRPNLQDPGRVSVGRAPEVKGATLPDNRVVSRTPSTEQVSINDDDDSGFAYRPTWQRDIPILGAGMDFLYRRLNSPDYSNADAVIDTARMVGTPVNIPVETIGDYRRRNPFDKRYLVNLANQNRAAGVRTLTNTAGGNRAMDLLGAANLAHSNQADLGEIMRQAYLANRQDDAQVAEFNRGTNLYNMNAINQRNMAQASLNSQRQGMMLNGLSRGYAMRQGIKDAWDNDAMESFNSMLESLGARGKENEVYNTLTSMAEQGYYPHYYGDKGIIQLARPAKKGGKLNRKKRRF